MEKKSDEKQKTKEEVIQWLKDRRDLKRQETSHILSEEKKTKDGEKYYLCSCGLICRTKHNYNLHIECAYPDMTPQDSTGWPRKHFETVPYIKNTQRAVLAKGDLPNGIFLEITLKDDSSKIDFKKVAEALKGIEKLTKTVSELDDKGVLNNRLCSVVGIENKTWKLFDEEPPTDLYSFEEKFEGKEGELNKKKILFPKTSGDIFLFAKCKRVDLCYELSKRFILAIGKENIKSAKRTLGFGYLPLPMAGRDLTGFLDGTRNPDHLLRAISDEVVIYPGDNKPVDGGKDTNKHVGGSYMYVGRWVHDLDKFSGMKKDEKNQIIGRDYHSVKTHHGYDKRPENPHLEKTEESAHIKRGYASMYRHAMPYIHEEEEGLYFIGFSRFLTELDTTINRMCGHYSKSGKADNLFKISKAVTANYYYVPSLVELQNIKLVKKKKEVEKEIKKEKVEDKRDVEIQIEYCTNCGYKTIYLENKLLLESISKRVKVIGNPEFPRLSAFEIKVKNGPLLWSKLAQPDGRNNYPKVFPQEAVIVKKLREFLKIANNDKNFPKKASIYEDSDTKVGVW